MYEFIQIITAVIYGLVEGITEWLPVSSTGHLILLDEFLSFSLAPDEVFTAEFCEMFDVVIQLDPCRRCDLFFTSLAAESQA